MSTAESLVVGVRMPALPDPHLPRERLSRAIRATQRCCLISAPHGYGASTAVAAALAEVVGRVDWVAVDADAAESALLDLIGDAVLRLPDGDPEPQPQWCVVDGLQRHHARVWAQLRATAKRLLPHQRLVVTTPHRPPIEWEVMASENGSLLLDSDALAFTTDEAVRLLQAWCAGVDIDTIFDVVEECEGWPTAVAAAGACARSGRIDRDWLRTTAAAQLFAGWLAAQPAGVRELLIATSVSDVLSADLVEAITGDSAAAQDVLHLDEQLGYLVPAAPPAGLPGRWWRRHGLLTAALQQRTHPDRAQHHARAADWFASQGEITMATHHMVAAERTADAGYLLLRHVRRLFTAGRATEVLAIHRSLSGDWGGGRLQRLLVLGWGQLLSGDPQGAALTLASLDALIRCGPAVIRPLLPAGDPELVGVDQASAQVDLLRAVLAGYAADTRTMVEAATSAGDVLGGHPLGDAYQLARITALRGLILSARFEASRSLCRRLQDEPFPNDVLREGTLIPLFAIQGAIDGEVRRSTSLVARTRTWCQRTLIQPDEATGFAALSAQAIVACESGDVRRSMDLAGAVIARAEQRQHLVELVAALTLRARARCLLGEYAGAQGDLVRACDLVRSGCPGSGLLGFVGRAQVALHLATGDLIRAERVLDSVPHGEDWDLSKAAVLLATQPAAAVRMLGGLNPQTPRARSVRHLLLATALAGSSRVVAQRHLRRAAAIADEYGMALLLVDASPALVRLAAETAVEAQDDALRWSLAQRERLLGQQSAGQGDRSEPAGQPLSRGELQLIAMLPSRAGNAEIAAMLGISVNTVKTRLRRLYAKLGASSRDDAVAKAQQRGLIPVGTGSA